MQHCGQLLSICVCCLYLHLQALCFELNNNSASCPYLIVHIKWYALFISIYISFHTDYIIPSTNAWMRYLDQYSAILFILYETRMLPCCTIWFGWSVCAHSIQSILKIVFILPLRLHAFAFNSNDIYAQFYRQSPGIAPLKTMVAEIAFGGSIKHKRWTENRRTARTRIKMA